MAAALPWQLGEVSKAAKSPVAESGAEMSSTVAKEIVNEVVIVGYLPLTDPTSNSHGLHQREG